MWILPAPVRLVVNRVIKSRGSAALNHTAASQMHQLSVVRPLPPKNRSVWKQPGLLPFEASSAPGP